MSNRHEKDDALYPCGCVEAKVLDTGHYCDRVTTNDFETAIGLATDCFDMCELEERMSRILH